MKFEVYQLDITAGEDFLRQHVGQLVEMTPAQEITHSIPIVGPIKISIEDFRLMNLKTKDDGLYLQISFNVDGRPIRRMRKMMVRGHLELEGKLYLADEGGWLQSLQFDLIDLRWIETNLKDVKWAIEKVTDVLESKVESQINEKIDEITNKAAIVEQLKSFIRPIPVGENMAMEVRYALVRLQDLAIRHTGISMSFGLEGRIAKSDTRSTDIQLVDIQVVDERKGGSHVSSVHASMEEINELLQFSLPQVNTMIPVEQVQVERLNASCPSPQRLQIDVFTTQLKRPLVTRFHIWLDSKRQMLELLDFDLTSHSEASIITRGLVKIFKEKVEEKVQSIFPLEIRKFISVILSTAEEQVGHLVDFDTVRIEVSELVITEEGMRLDFASDIALSLRTISST